MLRACQATTAARAARQQTTVNSIPLPSSRSDFVNSYCGCGLNRRIQGNEVWALGRRAQSPELRRGANAPPLGACDHAVKRRATPVKRRVTPVKCALSLHSCGPSGTTRPCTSSTCTRPSSTLRAWCLGKCDHAAKRRIAPVKCCITPANYALPHCHYTAIQLVWQRTTVSRYYRCWSSRSRSQRRSAPVSLLTDLCLASAICVYSYEYTA